jgi:hypothetical protein
MQRLMWLKVQISALQGQQWAVEFIADRTEGKVKASVDLTSGGDKIENVTYNVISVEQQNQIQNFHRDIDAI